MNPSSPAQKPLTRVDYWASAVLALALVPLLMWLHLPVSFDWPKLLIGYWLILSMQSIFVAIILTLIGFPPESTITPLFHRFRADKRRIALALAYFVVLYALLGIGKAVVLTVDTIALLELRERLKPKPLRAIASAVLWPGLYLFAGFLLVFAYNDIILSLRFFGAYDATFNAIDRWVLHGSSVSGLSHWAAQKLPVPAFRSLEFIYFAMFFQVGAGLVITSIYYGKQHGLRFVGSILTAYYLALLLFYLWPSQGPYYLCPSHFSQFPRGITYASQKMLLTNSLALWNHQRLPRISTDYYIAFPCMHIVQPLIAMWFLRRWKRMVLVMAIYDVILVGAIVLLEWHYIVDILAGVPLAALAVLISGSVTAKLGQPLKLAVQPPEDARFPVTGPTSKASAQSPADS